MLQEATLRPFILNIFRNCVVHLTKVLYLFHCTP